MRTYDPAERIAYLHIGQRLTPPPVPEAPTCEQLPSGYANRSAQTRLSPAPSREPARRSERRRAPLTSHAATVGCVLSRAGV